ncbi:MAG: pilus assembly protein TadG-related protein [Chloroflexota bacterium]
MSLNPRRRPHVETGQVLPLFAIVIIALIGITALVIDQGLLQGQRRYDQNGSDSGALAAARRLAASADIYNSAADVYFMVDDASVESVAFDAALANQNVNVATAGNLVVSLEYAPTPGNWCLSPASQARYPGVTFATTTQCTLVHQTIDGVPYDLPPFPAASDPYRVRVVVSSTTEPVFYQALQELVDPGHGPNGAPAYCERAPGADPEDLTTCARAVAAVRGSTIFGGEGPLLPVTRGNCDLLATTFGSIHALMGPHNAADCGFANLNPWKNVVDFSDAAYWEDGDDYDYDWDNLTAAPAPAPNEAPDRWNRDNGRFVPDGTWGFNGEMPHDFLRWAAYGFRGTVTPDDADGTPNNGSKLPTYVNASPAVGAALGSYIADGFYCNGQGDEDSCPNGVNPSGQYFFSQSTDPDFGSPAKLPCDDEWGEMYKDAPKRIGCRDATILVWGNTLEWADRHGYAYSGFVNGTANAPDRLMPVRFVNMRLYCEEGNRVGECEEPPKSIVGHAGTSELFGRYAPPFLNGCPSGGSCNVGPNANGVWVTLEE